MNLDEAKKWDDGCCTCDIRNGFIIPEIAAMLNRQQVTSIVDLGAGTGYIARQIYSLLEHPHTWLLIDKSEARCQVAKAKVGSNADISIRCADIFETDSVGGPETIYIFCNTALEMKLTGDRLDHLAGLARRSLGMLVSIPDTLSDVLKDTQVEDGFAKFKEGTVELSKTDDFTGDFYPFHAHRPIEIVFQFLQRGLCLSAIRRTDQDDGQYLFLFSASDLADGR